MSKHNSSYIRGAELLAELHRFCSRTVTPAVKTLLLGVNQYHPLPANQVLLMVKAGVFEGQVYKGRVYKIREIDPRASSLVKDTHYLDDRAVIRFHTDQTQIPVGWQNKRKADLWNDMLTRNPQPQSWVPVNATP